MKKVGLLLLSMFLLIGCAKEDKVIIEESKETIDVCTLEEDIICYEDGFVIEYTPNFMRYRCEQMGVKTVPVLWKGIIPYNEAEIGYVHDHNETPIKAGEWIKNIAEQYYDGPDPVGKTHVREGVVVRIINRPKFCAYKHKNFAFKVLEGLIKEKAAEPDMEEAQEVEKT